ncbi:MAG: NAD(P)/FAD-dependent oxidoreductase [Hyphomicrobiaceae bacterium]
MPSFDAIVIGGGHNGLVAATLIARSGRRTVLLEAFDQLGGAARTVEIAPGYRVSEVAGLVTHLGSKAVAALGLEAHGLTYAVSDMESLLLDGHRPPLGMARSRIVGDVADSDRTGWQDLHRRLARFAGTLRPFLAETPPRLKGHVRQAALPLGRLGLAVRKLGKSDMRDFLRMLLMNIADVVEEDVRDERIKALVAFDAVLGTHLGPRSPGSLLTYLYRLAGEADGRHGAIALPAGGMGTVIAALEGTAMAAGVDIRTRAAVDRIVIENDRAVGVVLGDGETLRAEAIVSAANPVTTLMHLVGVQHLDTDTVRRLASIRSRGNVARLHLALDGLPEFTGVAVDRMTARLVLAPSLEAIERAFDHAKYGEISAEPVMEVVVPSVADPGLAPAGRHVLSANVQFAPYRLKTGWVKGKDELKAKALAVLERHAPGIGSLIRHAELLSAVDIETRCRMPGGHWHHGELTVDQMFWLRPMQVAAQYRSPIPGLWLAGAGSHPGGNVMGLAGANAARAVIAGEGKAWH